MGTSSGSQNLVGELPDTLATLETILLAASLLVIWIWFARGKPTTPRFLQAAVAAIVAYVAFGKVLSPQYMAWLIPLVPLLGGRRGLAAASIALVALWLTGDYFPRSYFPYIQDTDRNAAWIVFLRDVALVLLLAVAALPVGPLWRRSVLTVDRLRMRLPARAIAAHPVQVLVVLLIGFFVLRALWITKPDGALIFDESYYVNAARVMDGIHPLAGQPYADAPLYVDPNTEHPPLGKAAIAAAIRLLGDNAFAWRLPSLIAAMIALVAVYGIVIAAGETAWLAILAVALLGLDNLTFVHGRIGTLDMMATAAILVGAWLALRGRPSLAGAAFGVGSLIKVTAFFGYLAFVLVLVVLLAERYRRGARISLRRLQPLIYGSVAYAVVGLGGLALLDRLYTSFATPIDHVRQMLGYGIALTGGPSPSGIASSPWDWLLGRGSFDYLRVDVSVLANGATVATYPTIEFQGALSPVLIGAAPLVVIFGVWLAIRQRHRLAGYAAIWLAANYLPYYALAIVAHRITYLYYILPAIPALAVLTAVFLLRSQLPRVVAYGYVVASALAFLAYFPFRQIP
jgi:predicted membrane-bound dolichyl-phosphate-mannose-protein mannosyltransferase